METTDLWITEIDVYAPKVPDSRPGSPGSSTSSWGFLTLVGDFP